MRFTLKATSMKTPSIRIGSLLTIALALTSISTAAAEGVRYVHTDHLGTPIAWTDESGNIIKTSEYEPYGLQVSGPVEDGPGYTGHVEDAATGLVHMQQRYYDPGIGMFLSVDPVTAYDNGDMRHFNRYAYAYDNPYSFNDPDGRCPNCVVGAAAFVADVVIQVAIEERDLGDVNYVRSALVGVTAAGGALVTGLYAAGTSGAAATVIEAGGAALTGMASASAASLAEGGNISDGMNLKSAVSGVLGGKLASGPAGELATEIEGNLISAAIDGSIDQAGSMASELTNSQTEITKALNDGDFEMRAE